MRLLVLSILLICCRVSTAQHVYLAFKVVEEYTEVEFDDSTFAKIWLGDSLVHADTAMFWGLGGFRLGFDTTYTFEVGKIGYVSKRGEIDTRHPQPDSLGWRTIVNLWVGLFPECKHGDYEFMKTEPLIKMHLDEYGMQDWDRDYANKMAKKVDDAHFSKFSPEDKDLHISVMEEGKALYEIEEFEAALGIFENAENYVSCGLVRIMIDDCQRQIAKKRQFKEFVTEGDAFFDKGKYSKAQEKYYSAVTLYPDDTYVKERLERIEAEMSKKKQ